MNETVRLPLRVESLNVWNSMKFKDKLRKKKAEKLLVTCVLNNTFKTKPKVKAVRLTRLAPRAITDKEDNLTVAFKHVRDMVAFWLGLGKRLGQGDDKIHWLYEQQRSREYGVRIEFLAQYREPLPGWAKDALKQALEEGNLETLVKEWLCPVGQKED